MKNLGILLSGRGSNFEAIAKNVASKQIRDARIAVVISNKPDAGGLGIANRFGLDAVVIPSKGKQREQHDPKWRLFCSSIKWILSAWPDTCGFYRPGSYDSFLTAS